MKYHRSIIIFLVVGIIVSDYVTIVQGWWWITLILGALFGLLLRYLLYKGVIAIILSFSEGCLSWGLPLLVWTLHGPAMKVASVVESVIGISETGGWLIVILTILLGSLLSLLGTWVGTAIMQVYQSMRADVQPQKM